MRRNLPGLPLACLLAALALGCDGRAAPTDGGPLADAGLMDGAAADAASCVPRCEGRACGPDGCGGRCGSCPGSQVCNEVSGACGDECVPATCGDVAPGACGGLPDGCGGELLCDACASPETCGGGGVANECGCTPVCDGRSCGDDGCGGSCGGCDGGLTCVDGDCVAPCVEAAGGRHTFDIPEIRISGSFTIAGAPVTAGWGVVDLRGIDGEGTARLGETRAPYAVGVVPGTYDIVYSYRSGTDVPINDGAVIGRATLTSSGTLDVDVPRIALSGSYTNAGAPMPAGSEAAISLVDDALGVVSLGRTDAPYAVQLVPGSYDIVYTHRSGPDLPANEGASLGRITRSTSGTLDIDIPEIGLSGSFTNEGAPMPAGSSASIELESPELGRLPLGEAAAPYAVRALPGTYDVVYRYRSGADLPRNDRAVLSTVTRTTSGTLDVDIPEIGLSGSFTNEGAAMPAGSEADVRLSSATLGTVSLGRTTAPYAVRALPGTYDVLYRHVSGPDLPRNTSGALSRGVALTTSRTLDVDIPEVALSGALTHRGSAAPSGSSARIRLRALDDTAGEVVLGDTDASIYATRALPGRYEVVYQHLTGADVPRNRGATLETVEVTVSRTLDVDVPAGELIASFTNAGAAVPAANSAQIFLGRAGDTGEVPVPVGSPTTLWLLPGTYRASYHHGSGVDLPVNDGATLPCFTLAASTGGSVTRAAPGLAGDVVITELMPNPSAVTDAQGEWVELHNPSATVTRLLDGCVLTDDGGQRGSLSGLEIPPGGYVAVAIGASPGFAPAAVYGSGFGLTNTADEVILDCGGLVVDRVAYTADFGFGDGVSASARPGVTAAGNDGASAWCAGSTDYHMGDLGSPGSANPPCP